MRYYYDCPITAAFMAKYHHFTFGYGDNIHTVFENLCTEKPEEANGSVRFYLDDKSIAQLKPQEGDIGLDRDDLDLPYVYRAGNWHDHSVSDDEATIVDKDWQEFIGIIFRNDKPFITPKE